MSCHVENGCQAGEKSQIEGVCLIEFGFDQGHHLNSDRLVLVLFDGQGGELGSSFQHGHYLLLMEDPGKAVKGVPGPDAVDVVADGLTQK